MGLDMYAYKTSAQIADTDFDAPDHCEEIAYWRKHPKLHGWMEALYRRKGGAAEFNCVPVKLDEADLDALEHAVNADELPFTCGFFFGESRPEEKGDDLAFIRNARAAIAAGMNVFYSSWW